MRCEGGFGHGYPDYYSCPNTWGDFSRSVGRIVEERTLDEMELIFAPGRLNEDTRNVIWNTVDAYSGDEQAKLRLMWQLFASTAEYHATNIVRKAEGARPAPAEVTAPPPGYKAVVYLFLAGGADTYNLLVPRECSDRTVDEDTIFEEYRKIRGTAALTSDQLLNITVNTQGSCTKFGIHHKLPLLQQLYNEGELSFLANTGVLFDYSSREDYKTKHSSTQLFAHNVMQTETDTVDAFNEVAGSGVLGRLMTVLRDRDVAVGSVSLDDEYRVLVGEIGNSVPVQTVGTKGVDLFIDSRYVDGDYLRQGIEAVNNRTSVMSSLYGETWSQVLLQALQDSDFLYQILEDAPANPAVTFPSTGFGSRLSVIGRLITAQAARGSHRDSYTLRGGGWDMHSAVLPNLDLRFEELNDALTAFVDLLKEEGLYNNVTIVIASEFGRTLSANSGDGVDHGWGGNYVMLGGDVNGGKVFGQYPTDLTDESPTSVGRGRMIPTTAWESVWHGITNWLAENDLSDSELDYILPNRDKFAGDELEASTLFKSYA
tara:strand:+ start:69 stop:1694 length:1626 start_codon:yes stop_codon:yes gene_type:complete